jgi:hypothetical protein
MLNAKKYSNLAERSGFEPSVPRGLIRAEFGPSLARHSVRIKAPVLERICSPRIRLCFGCLRFSSFARPMRGIGLCRTSGEGFGFNICLFGIARGGVRAGGGAVAVCSAVSPATKNEQMMTEGEDLQIQDRPATESAGKSRDDGTHELKHAGDTWPPITKPLDFSDRSEFLVATGQRRRFLG